MEIKVSVEDVDLTSVIGQRYDDEDGRVPTTLGEAVAREIVESLKRGDEYRTLAQQVQDIRTEEIRRQVEDEVRAALTGSVERTNQFGERTGKTTTLREEIVRLAADALKVDHRNSYSRELTPAQKVIREEVDRAIAGELKAAVDDEKAKVVAAVRAKAAELIATAVKEGVGR